MIHVIFIPIIFSVGLKKHMSASCDSCYFYVIISDTGIPRDYISFCDFIFGLIPLQYIYIGQKFKISSELYVPVYVASHISIFKNYILIYIAVQTSYFCYINNIFKFKIFNDAKTENHTECFFTNFRCSLFQILHSSRP